MELKDILNKRRSVRKFSDREVEPEVVEQLIEATLKAPSSRNSRSTHLTVISNRETIEHIASMRDYGSSFVKGAPLVILVAGDREATDLWEVNCSISATLLQLTATDLGLASCWVHIHGRAHRQAEPNAVSAEQVVRERVDLPEQQSILCAVAIGYSDFTPAPLPPFDPTTKVSYIE